MHTVVLRRKLRLYVFYSALLYGVTIRDYMLCNIYSIDVKNVFYVFYSCHVFNVFNVFYFVNVFYF